MPFTPETFLVLLHREQRSCELVATAVFIRAQLRKLDPKLVTGDTVAVFLERRAHQLHN